MPPSEMNVNNNSASTTGEKLSENHTAIKRPRDETEEPSIKPAQEVDRAVASTFPSTPFPSAPRLVLRRVEHPSLPSSGTATPESTSRPLTPSSLSGGVTRPKLPVSVSTTPRTLAKSPLQLRPGTGLGAKSPAQLSGSASSSARSSPKSLANPAAARAEKWGGILLPHMMMEQEPSNKDAVLEVCKRIAAAVPGDKLEARDTFMMLVASLKDPLNSTLRKRVISGELPVEVLVTLSEKELANPVVQRELEEGFKERSKDTNLTEIANAMKTSSKLFVCPSCKARDCSWVQRQTRSGDEPMTVICSCNICDHQWRKY